MICPIMSYHDDYGTVDCRSDCAWYRKATGMCSVLHISCVMDVEIVSNMKKPMDEKHS